MPDFFRSLLPWLGNSMTSRWNRNAACDRSPLLAAGVPLYWAGRSLHRAIYLLGLRKRIQLPGVTVGIGNLTVGGTGKTPVTVEVASALKKAGYRVCVLTRGYGAADSGVRVVSDGKRILVESQCVGEEAVLLAERLPGIPVIKGKQRDRSGNLANRLSHSNAFVLDDSFQYDRVVKNLEFLCIDATVPLAREHLLPWGRLREPTWCARRADALVLTRAGQAGEELLHMRKWLSYLTPGKAVLEGRLRITELVELPEGKPCSPRVLQGGKLCCFMAVGSPVSFVRLLRTAGTADLVPLPFPDHHRYSRRDLERIHRIMHENECTAVVMTEKDYVSCSRLMTGFIGRIRDDSRIGGAAADIPWYVVRVRMQVEPEADFDKLLRCAGSSVSGQAACTVKE